MCDNEAESFGQRNEYLPPSLPPSLEQAKLGDKVYFSLKSTNVMFSPFPAGWVLGVLVARTGLGQGQYRAADQLLCVCVLC